MRINVTGGGDVSGRDVSYTVAPGQRVYFTSGSFSTASYNANARQLSYIRIDSLPSSSQGILYYGSGSRVSTGQNFYLETSSRSRNLINDIYFAANSSYSGSFTIPYTGYSVSETSNTSVKSFTGQIYISVGTGTTRGSGNVAYSVRNGDTVYFSASDFSQASFSSSFSRSYFRSAAWMRYSTWFSEFCIITYDP